MKQFEADVAVIGAGTAGMAAIVAAAESGAAVIAVEKSGRTGGTGNMASGLFAVESRLQRVRQLSLTREEAFKTYMNFTHWRVNARLVKAFFNKSASTIDWLEGMGVEFRGVQSHGVGNNYTQHTVKGQHDMSRGTGPAAVMMKILAEKARELGARILLKTPALSILNEDGCITGVMAKDESGGEIQVNARAVINATGGYYSGKLPGLPGLVGDGPRMVREVGGATTEKDVLIDGRRPSGPGPWFMSSFGMAMRQPNLMVNLLGERFMNEEIVMSGIYERNAYTRQKDATVFSIIDEDTKNHYMEAGFDFSSGGIENAVTRAADFEADLKQALERGAGSVFVADSLEELAEETGIDPKGLRETVDEYNQACETGRDDVFGKKARYLMPVKRPKFYATKSIGDAIGGWNGIRINHRTEVMTGDYKVIPGLYATGMDAACEIYHDTYPFVLPATAMGFAINSGRMAGENAAAYIKPPTNKN